MSPQAAVRHPARYSDALLPIFSNLLIKHRIGEDDLVLDPFAGTGRIHELRPLVRTLGIEIEPEWANLNEFTLVGDATRLPSVWAGKFAAVVTSPTYGNRFADSHNAKDDSTRRSYTHDLGRPLHPMNTGQMHWGDQYRTLHRRAWREVHRVLRPDGIFILNVKDHYRSWKIQGVPEWHKKAVLRDHFRLLEAIEVPVPGMKFGANSHLRVDHEMVYVFRRVAFTPHSTDPNPTTEED